MRNPLKQGTGSQCFSYWSGLVFHLAYLWIHLGTYDVNKAINWLKYLITINHMIVQGKLLINCKITVLLIDVLSVCHQLILPIWATVFYVIHQKQNRKMVYSGADMRLRNYYFSLDWDVLAGWLAVRFLTVQWCFKKPDQLNSIQKVFENKTVRQSSVRCVSFLLCQLVEKGLMCLA